MTTIETKPHSPGVFAALMEIAKRIKEGRVESLTLEQQYIRQTALETSTPELGPVLAAELAQTLEGEETPGLEPAPGELT